jgi:adenylosuccinate synthase
MTLDGQATRNGIRAGDLRDPDTFAAKLRVLALDGAKRFDGFEYDVEADIDTYKAIAKRVLPMCAGR